MNTNPHTPNRDSLHLQVREYLADEIAELRGRVADLIDERDVYRFWWQQTLHALADLTAKHGRHRDEYQRLQDEARDLRAMVVTGYYEDAIAVIDPEMFAAVRASLATGTSERAPLHPPAGVQ